jgi:salicylate hydroxylase
MLVQCLLCDGINSSTRKIVLGSDAEADPIFSGAYCYRCIVPTVKVEKIIGADLAHTGNIYCGYGSYITVYPIGKVSSDAEDCEFVNVVAVRKVTRGVEWDTDERPTKGMMLQEFEGWDPKLLKLLEEMELRPKKWPLFEARHWSYHHGRVCLLGDAAHASTPHQGSGAGMGFEDAYVMGQLLPIDGNDEDVMHAFAAFDVIRRLPAQGQIETAHDALRIYMLSDEARKDDLAHTEKL